MNDDKLQHWLDKRIHRIEDNALAIAPYFIPDPIHEFRTETKKLRAVMRMLSDDDDFSLPHSFKGLYHKAGTIRDLQVQLQFIASDKTYALPPLATWLANEISTASQAWSDDHHHAPLKRLRELPEYLEPRRIDQQTLGNYFKKKLAQMRELTAKGPGDEELHELRKLVKDMLYVLEASKKVWPSLYPAFAFLKSDLQELAEAAGIYNDKTNLLAMLQRFFESFGPQLNADEKATVEAAIKEWDANRRAEKVSVLAAADRLLSLGEKLKS